MNTRLIFTALSLITTAAFAADLSTVPAESIARKKELLFSDDFESATPAKPWHRVVDTFVFEKGALKGMQTRDKNVPATDGNPAAYLKSSGIGHATKSKIELGVAGKDGYFDDIKVWNAEPAKP